jgi:YD repeat-containing protein
MEDRRTIFYASASNSYAANGNPVQSDNDLGIPRQPGYEALRHLVRAIDNDSGAN